MLVLDPDLLDTFKGPGNCERCGQWFQRRDPHHHFVKKGAGGGSRLDLPENLISLCRGCHNAVHAVWGLHMTVSTTIALRCYPPSSGKRVLPSMIREWLAAVLRAPKNGPIPPRPWETVNADSRAAGDRNHPLGADNQPTLEEGHPGDTLRPAVPPESPVLRRPGVEADEGWSNL